MKARRLVVFLLCVSSLAASGQKKNPRPDARESKGSKGTEAAETGSPQAESPFPQVDQFFLFYIDNSRAERGDGLVADAKERISRMTDSVSRLPNCRFLVYGSNGNEPVSCDESKRLSKTLLKILEGENTLYPDEKSFDRDSLCALVYRDPFTVKKSITLCYFVTEYFAKSLLKTDASLLVSSLADELNYVLGNNSASTSIRFYYTRKSPETKKDDLARVLSFRSGLKPGDISLVPLE